MSVVTLLSPNSKSPGPSVFSKKFGDQPKSASNPTMPWPIQPSEAPKSTRRSNSSSKSSKSPNRASPPKLAPRNGVNNQSAEARDGSAAVSTPASATERNTFLADMLFLQTMNTADQVLLIDMPPANGDRWAQREQAPYRSRAVQLRRLVYVEPAG